MNSWILTNAIAAWLIPPGCLILLAAWGIICLRKQPRAGKALIALSLVALWALSTPWLSRTLLQTLEPEPVDPLLASPAQAIVVLGGGQYFNAPEFGADTVSEATLQRLRYTAWLHRKTGKPILVSGGKPEASSVSEAQVMRAVLEDEFKVPVAWMETGSNNTLDEARICRDMLAPLGIKRIYLVTHAWHMPRSQDIFAKFGFDVVIAPTHYATHFRTTILDFRPYPPALKESSHFFHEIIGLAWYRLKSALN